MAKYSGKYNIAKKGGFGMLHCQLNKYPYHEIAAGIEYALNLRNESQQVKNNAIDNIMAALLGEQPDSQMFSELDVDVESMKGVYEYLGIKHKPMSCGTIMGINEDVFWWTTGSLAVVAGIVIYLKVRK